MIINRLLSNFVIFIIRIYKVCISPVLPFSCRFHPSCSTYAIEAIISYGLMKGIWKGFKRILKCHPLSKGGYDPVNKS
ncbi:MAG: membrane protein insertion efficiency factor YidD [Thermodesulfobacteriota bacterium]